MDDFVLEDPDTCRLTDKGQETVDLAWGLFADGLSIEDMLRELRLESLDKLQFLLTVDSLSRN